MHKKIEKAQEDTKKVSKDLKSLKKADVKQEKIIDKAKKKMKKSC